jgi:hypothetical protein
MNFNLLPLVNILEFAGIEHLPDLLRAVLPPSSHSATVFTQLKQIINKLNINTFFN